MSDIDTLRALLGPASITVEKIRNEPTRQTRFVVFSEDGEKLFEGRHEVTAAWIAGFLYARKEKSPDR